MRRSSSWTVGLLILVARVLPSQAIGQGFELERAGQYEQAAAIYLATLRADPTNLSALLGLERVLPPLNRLRELLPAAQRAAAASPTNAALRGVLLRTDVGLDEPDSARAVAPRWTAAPPRGGDSVAAWAEAGGRAAVGLGAGAARLGRVRAERRHAVRGCRVRAAALRRSRGRAQHAGRAPGARPRARALGRPDAGAWRCGDPGTGRGGARLHRGGRRRSRACRARACGARLDRASRCPAARAARRGGGPDRRRAARYGRPPAL